MLVGHPGETEADFEDLIGFVEETKFDRLGVFQYSHEENTHAGTLIDDVPPKSKKNGPSDSWMFNETYPCKKTLKDWQNLQSAYRQA